MISVFSRKWPALNSYVYKPHTIKIQNEFTSNMVLAIFDSSVYLFPGPCLPGWGGRHRAGPSASVPDSAERGFAHRLHHQQQLGRDSLPLAGRRIQVELRFAERNRIIMHNCLKWKTFIGYSKSTVKTNIFMTTDNNRLKSKLLLDLVPLIFRA